MERARLEEPRETGQAQGTTERAGEAPKGFKLGDDLTRFYLFRMITLIAVQIWMQRGKD